MSTTQYFIEIKEDGVMKRFYNWLTGRPGRTMYVYQKSADGRKELLTAYDTQKKDLGTWEWSDLNEAGAAIGAILGPLGEFFKNVFSINLNINA